MEKQEGSSDSDMDTVKELNVGSRKRKCTGRLSDVMKKLRLSTHELGPDCKCVRFRCFEKITLCERRRIIKEFNEMSTRDEQNS